MKQQMIVLMTYLVIFGAITILGIIDYSKNVQIVDLGLSTKVTNLVIIVLGFAGIIKSGIYILFYTHKSPKYRK